MEKASPNTIPHSFSLAFFIEFLLFHGYLNWVTKILNFYSSFPSSLQSKLEFIFGKSNSRSERKNSNSELLSQNSCINEKVDDGKLSREDVEMVMGKLRIVCYPEAEKLQERLGVDELSVLFEEKEPSLEEVNEAFDVFDENRDGFIDAKELQRVLCSLGFRQGSEVAECERMIRAFDENGDGRIDFNEFVNFMENSFC